MGAQQRLFARMVWSRGSTQLMTIHDIITIRVRGGGRRQEGANQRAITPHNARLFVCLSSGWFRP